MSNFGLEGGEHETYPMKKVFAAWACFWLGAGLALGVALAFQPRPVPLVPGYRNGELVPEHCQNWTDKYKANCGRCIKDCEGKSPCTKACSQTGCKCKSRCDLPTE
jgi:hypothetical protein